MRADRERPWQDIANSHFAFGRGVRELKEAIIAFLLALVIGSYLNGRQVDSGNGPVPSVPIGDDPPPPTDFGGQQKQLAPNSRMSIQAVPASDVKIPRLDEPGFDRDVIKSATPVLVFFTATGSDACQRELHAVEEVASQTQSDLRVVQVDVMSYPALGQQWGAVSVPTFAMFKDGVKVESASGELDSMSLMQMVKRVVPNVGH